MKRIVLSAILIASATGLSGCFLVLAAGGAAGTVAWVKGELKASVTQDVPVVYAASMKAMDDLKIPVSSSGQDALSATVAARDAQDKKIDITIKRDGTVTNISIRVGFWGDQAKSQTILDKIKSHLS
jgi:hypothetical protein